LLRVLKFVNTSDFLNERKNSRTLYTDLLSFVPTSTCVRVASYGALGPGGFFMGRHFNVTPAVPPQLQTVSAHFRVAQYKFPHLLHVAAYPVKYYGVCCVYTTSNLVAV